MPKQSLASIAKGVRTAMKKHSPEILTGIGIAGMITTTVMAVKATPYGEKSPDGKRFVKSEELSTAFSQTEAYSQLYMELATDADKAAEFINGVIPNKKPAASQHPAIAPVNN